MIAIVDYGMGNRRSVEKAFEKVGAPARLTSDVDEIAAADGIVVPGVGAFPEAMRRLREKQLSEGIVDRARAGIPVIGLCLGMQLLFTESFEHEGARGLDLLPGRVVKHDSAGEKLPHIGWNTVGWRRRTALNDGLTDPAAFYHVHSYVVECDDEIVLGEGDYGTRFVSFVERDNVFGAQCHPEKSSTDGLALLRNFANVCDRVSA